MKKNLFFLFLFIFGFLSPIISRAVAYPFPNPGNGFLIDWGSNNNFGYLLLFLVNIALGIVGILSFAFIVYGGFQYITAHGNEEQAESGKKTLTNAIIGLVVVILSYQIMAVVINALKGSV